MWLSHHYPEDYDRCVLVGRTYVCRRCLLLYPLTLVVLIMARSGLRWPRSFDVPALILLPVPAVLEFVLEHLDVLGYRPTRQLLVTGPLAVAVGIGLDRYLRRNGDPLFWAMALGYGAICVGALMVGTHRRRGRAERTSDPDA